MQAPVSSRVLSVDVLRGLTIALMILVNDPGDWAHTYAQLDHAPWNGFTLTDLVFPNFLFLVGASIVLSLQARLARGASRRALAEHMVRRAATLVAIKLLLSAYPHFHLSHLRLYGVLTRIALCYLAAGLLCLVTLRMRMLLGVAAVLLVGYWALLRLVPVPGLGTPGHALPMLDPERNLAAWLDRAVNGWTQRVLHTGSLYNKTHDPEGLLSTLPAIATTLLGAVAALWLRRSGAKGAPGRGGRTLAGLLAAGGVCLTLGLAWSPWFPINKNLWTSSYVLFAAGWSLVLLGLCFYAVDMQQMQERPLGQRVLFPLLVFGSNAIFAFVFSNLVVETMLWIKVPARDAAHPGGVISSWNWVYVHLFARGHSTEMRSLAFAVAFTAFCFVPVWWLWRRRIFLKI